jgi:hypothetical protein
LGEVVFVSRHSRIAQNAIHHYHGHQMIQASRRGPWGAITDLHVEGKIDVVSVLRYRVQRDTATIGTTATVANDFEIRPELDPVWTQFGTAIEVVVL